jgi:ribosome recycling factor
MSLIRLVLQFQRNGRCSSRSLAQCLQPTHVSSRLVAGSRSYATKGKTKSTATFVPGSKQPITDEAARQEYAKAETIMNTAAEWFRKECASSEARASGRVTPALLSPVRVKLPSGGKECKLEELATVGVRDGTTLLITLFDEHVSLSPFTGLLRPRIDISPLFQ